jgi:hypothetical protein
VKPVENPSIAYVIATYSGTDHVTNKELSPVVLAFNISQLIRLLTNKKLAGIASLITHVVIVVPPVPADKQFPGYYRLEEWTSGFAELGVICVALPYVGANKHHSYDQWIQGCMCKEVADVSHFIVIEDDYCVDDTNLTGDSDLLLEYKSIFPDDVGYLASWVTLDEECYEKAKVFFNLTSHAVNAAISNGMISKKTWSYFFDPLQFFFTMPKLYPQLLFSYMFTISGINIVDFRRRFSCLFWDSSSQTMKDYTDYDTPRKKHHLLVPVQHYLISSKKNDSHHSVFGQRD